MKLLLIGLAAVTPLALSSTTHANNDKVTICHVAGRADDPANYVTQTIAWQAVYGPGGHLNEDGTGQAGHEDDSLGECDPPEVTSTTEAPTTTAETTTTTEVVTETTEPETATTEPATTEVETTTTLAPVPDYCLVIGADGLFTRERIEQGDYIVMEGLPGQTYWNFQACGRPPVEVPAAPAAPAPVGDAPQSGARLPETGGTPWGTISLAFAVLGSGGALLGLARRSA